MKKLKDLIFALNKKYNENKCLKKFKNKINY
jgi:hypothetical protein